MRYNVEIVESLGPQWAEVMPAYFLPGEYLTIASADVAGVGHLTGLDRGPGELFYRVSEVVPLSTRKECRGLASDGL